MKNKICYLPFMNMTVNPSGSMAPCCKYDLLNQDKENAPLEQNTLFEKNINELFYQPEMVRLRESFLNGEEPEGCKVCWNEEASGVVSLRQHRNKRINQGHFSSSISTDDILKNPKIVTLDFKFSSLCNLKCRICGPYCSSSWLKESYDLETFDNYVLENFSKYSEKKFDNNEENFKILKSILPNIRIMEFYGGEPLMQPEHDKIINLIKETRSYHIDLFYNTNGTIYNQDVVNVWNNVKSVEVNISVDDIFERFEYQRYPAKWESVLENILKYKKNNSEFVLINLYCTVSLYNIFYIEEFIKFNTKHIGLNLRFNLLHWPHYMSIANLPSYIKDKVNRRMSMLSEQDKQYIEDEFSINNVINYMNSTKGSQKEITKFLAITSTHDKYRKQSFEDTFPEYYHFLSPNNL